MVLVFSVHAVPDTSHLKRGHFVISVSNDEHGLIGSCQKQSGSLQDCSSYAFLQKVFAANCSFKLLCLASKFLKLIVHPVSLTLWIYDLNLVNSYSVTFVAS